MVRLITFTMMLMFVVQLRAAEIKHKSVVLYLQDEVITLDLVEEYKLNETMLEALQNGVPLTFETAIRMREDGAFFWQSDVARVVLRNRLEYHPLSALYEVQNEDGNSHDTFSKLETALDALGIMQAVPIISRSDISDELHYMVTVDTGLDVNALPTPLRPAAYLLPRWHLQSKTWEWRLKP